MNNKDLIEEMLWVAFKNGVGVELAEAAGQYIRIEKLTRLEAYTKAFAELNLKL
jgi:hypothetical protein